MRALPVKALPEGAYINKSYEKNTLQIFNLSVFIGDCNHCLGAAAQGSTVSKNKIAQWHDNYFDAANGSPNCQPQH